MKFFRAYIITAIVCLCITACTCAIFIADENAKRITLNEKSAVLVLNSANESLYDDAVNPLPIILKLKEAAKKAASIAPPPISNIYWFSVNSEKLLN